MRLTAQELEEMRSVNIGAVEADKLADVSGMALDNKLPMEERLARSALEPSIPIAFAWAVWESRSSSPTMARRSRISSPTCWCGRRVGCKTLAPQSVPALRHFVPRRRHP